MHSGRRDSHCQHARLIPGPEFTIGINYNYSRTLAHAEEDFVPLCRFFQLAIKP